MILLMAQNFHWQFQSVFLRSVLIIVLLLFWTVLSNHMRAVHLSMIWFLNASACNGIALLPTLPVKSNVQLMSWFRKLIFSGCYKNSKGVDFEFGLLWTTQSVQCKITIIYSLKCPIHNSSDICTVAMASLERFLGSLAWKLHPLNCTSFFVNRNNKKK